MNELTKTILKNLQNKNELFWMISERSEPNEIDDSHLVADLCYASKDKAVKAFASWIKKNEKNEVELAECKGEFGHWIYCK